MPEKSEKFGNAKINVIIVRLEQCGFTIWAASSEFGTYRLCEQRRFRRACTDAVLPEPPLLAHTSSESRGTFRQKARSLVPLNGWAYAVKIYHDGMLEDTNSLDASHTVVCSKSADRVRPALEIPLFAVYRLRIFRLSW